MNSKLETLIATNKATFIINIVAYGRLETSIAIQRQSNRQAINHIYIYIYIYVCIYMYVYKLLLLGDRSST